MIEKYRDFYGCTATIRPWKGGFLYNSKTYTGRRIRKQWFKTHRGAMRAMSNDSDSLMERVNWQDKLAQSSNPNSQKKRRQYMLFECFIRAKDFHSYNQYMKVYVPAMITLSETENDLSSLEKWQQELQECIASWQRVNQPRTPFLEVIGELQFIVDRARRAKAQPLQIPFAKTA